MEKNDQAEEKSHLELNLVRSIKENMECLYWHISNKI